MLWFSNTLSVADISNVTAIGKTPYMTHTATAGVKHHRTRGHDNHRRGEDERSGPS